MNWFQSLIFYMLIAAVVLSFNLIRDLNARNNELGETILLLQDKADEHGEVLEEISYHVHVLESIGISIEVVQKPGVYDVTSVEFIR